jgi:cytochrome c553
MKTSEIVILAMAFAAGAGGAMAQEVGPASVTVTIDHCTNCHGYLGRNTSPIFPQLAGQQADYTESELKKFRDRTRGDKYAVNYMWGTAHSFTDEKIAALADYYATQKRAPGTPQDPAAVAAGQTIYTQGIKSQKVEDCASCHGDKALGSAKGPLLAGQHREYLESQLLAYKSGQRATTVMDITAKALTDEQIRQIAAYLASL